MIPKVIHYCWFGGNPLPELAQKCIASWRKFFPDYEIKEWNESNFDVNIIPYTAQAYAARKYAFVSDYARFWVLYREGGIYFDTDVEVIKPMDDIIARGSFMGCELKYNPKATPETMYVAPGLGLGVNPGLGLGVNPGLGLLKELLDLYATLSFLNPDGTQNQKTIVEYTTELLCKYGLKNVPDIQQVADVWIYPHDYFNPLNANTGVLKITENTHSIHWFAKSWCDKRNPIIEKAIQLSHRWFGNRSLVWLKRLVNKK